MLVGDDVLYKLMIYLLTNFVYFVMYIGVSCMEIKTEADSNDMTECSRDVKPTIGMFGCSNDVFSTVICLSVCFSSSLVVDYLFFLHLSQLQC